ncbi:MAG: hypothetical protein WC707_05325 [Candidatus Babeliaceae bacterium]|jgi:hypothetical protein
MKAQIYKKTFFIAYVLLFFITFSNAVLAMENNKKEINDRLNKCLEICKKSGWIHDNQDMLSNISFLQKSCEHIPLDVKLVRKLDSLFVVHVQCDRLSKISSSGDSYALGVENSIVDICNQLTKDIKQHLPAVDNVNNSVFEYSLPHVEQEEIVQERPKKKSRVTRPVVAPEIEHSELDSLVSMYNYMQAKHSWINYRMSNPSVDNSACFYAWSYADSLLPNSSADIQKSRQNIKSFLLNPEIVKDTKAQAQVFQEIDAINAQIARIINSKK